MKYSEFQGTEAHLIVLPFIFSFHLMEIPKDEDKVEKKNN